MPANTIFTVTLMIAANTALLEDVELLDKRIALIAGQQGGVARPIDKRVKLARCPSPATIEQQSETALAVRCSQLGWRIRVAIKQARTGQYEHANASQNNKVVVRKGEAVEIRVSGSSFSVSSSAVAMENGKAGEDIRIKSTRSRTPLVARVVRRGVVEIIN